MAQTEPLANLYGMEASDVAAALTANPQLQGNAITLLAQAALADAEQDTTQAALWLDAAEILTANLLTAGASVDGSSQALLAYARARLAVHRGTLAAAEESLRTARSLWLAAGDAPGAARSLLGLTQVLAMQGRFAEAEESIRQALLELASAAPPNDPEAQFHMVGAHLNLATILVMQDRHAAALEEYDAARDLLDALPGDDEESAMQLRAEAAHIALNRASALTFLDRPTEAEEALRQAIADFDALGDEVNRGRARTNLGRLHLRLGEYAQALRQFDLAAADLLGSPTDEAFPTDDLDDQHLRRGDELFLEQGYAYLALNLLPEAELALTRAERLFRDVEQPYELGQALYALGLVRMRGDTASAATPLNGALTHFAELGNAYWSVRTTVALAALDSLLGNTARAASRLDALPVQDATDDGALQWDIQSRAEALLLRADFYLAQGDTASAEGLVQRAAALTKTSLDAEGAPALAFWATRIYHLLGKVARARGDLEGARRWFSAAVALVDGQRSTLPLEEVRTAFLADKVDVYADLVLALLDAPLPSTGEVTAAFDLIERSRSRALLEQLLGAVEDVQPAQPSAIEEARRRLHSLYNQLLGEQGTRGLDAEMSRVLQQEEARVQRLEWQRAAHYDLAASATLRDFQSALAADQQALVYATAGSELMAFVVSPDSVHLARHLCHTDQLVAAAGELRFQLGRAALGADFLARHAQRLEEDLRAALQRLYDLALRPLAEHLHAERLLVIPSGALHSIPFHALWDGARYLVERFELAIAPSATLAVRLAHHVETPLRSWAGLAITDASIPFARVEVESIAQFFDAPALFLDDAASRAGLQEAAASDILHIATHGLYRGDNPFFSVLKLADGWIDVRELYRLKLAARLVVLSACESGAGALHPGDEVIGLARGFLGAGAQSIVAGLWHVQDDGAARLMERFYVAYATQGNRSAQANPRPAAALRSAQQQAIAEGQHPWLWGAFYVLGA